MRTTIGRILLVSGIVVLLFIPYQLWGTGLITSHRQAALRSAFVIARASSVPLPSGPAHPSGGPPTVAPPSAPPALGSAVGLISIPAIGLSMAIVEGTGTDQLRSGPGHYPATPLPGQAGNAAIAGHRTTYLHPFGDLDRLRPGDPIDIVTLQGRFVYRVTEQLVVDPTEVGVVAPTPTPELTLTTCNPRYSARQRLVIHAALVTSSLTPAASTGSPTPTRPAGRSSPATVATTSPESWWVVLAWGAAVLTVTIVTWWATARLRGGRRLLVVMVGTLVWLALLFELFGATATLLPANF